MACDECRDLNTHDFRSPDDLLHAVQVAAAETDRGVLERLQGGDRSLPEQEALSSALDARALPETVNYRFRCTTCGDRFALLADIRQGSGSWTRENKADAA